MSQQNQLPVSILEKEKEISVLKSKLQFALVKCSQQESKQDEYEIIYKRKIKSLEADVKRLNAELKSKKEAERSLREKIRQQIETAQYQLNKAKAIEARAWNSFETVQDQANEISNLKQLVNRLSTERDALQVKTDGFEERHQNMCKKDKEMKKAANNSKTEISKCKKQIKELSDKCTRYINVETKYKELLLHKNTIENDKRSFADQLHDKCEELNRMKQTMKELAAHEELNMKLSKEKDKLEIEMSGVENELKRMTTRALDTAKLKNENDMLYKTIESFKEQIKEKDDKLKKSQLDYQKILGELATQHSDNRRIMKIAKRSDLRFSRRRTISDLDSFKDDLRSAENTEKQLKSEAKSWGKRAESMRNLLGENHNSLHENDEDSIKESSSESSDDSSIVCSGVLRKQSENQAVLSNKDKVLNSLTVKKKGNKEINVYNIQNCNNLTVKSNITNQTGDEDNGNSIIPAIEESSE